MRNRKRSLSLSKTLANQLEIAKEMLTTFFVKHVQLKRRLSSSKTWLSEHGHAFKESILDLKSRRSEFKGELSGFFKEYGKNPALVRRGISSLLVIMLVIGFVAVAKAKGPYAVEINGERIAVVKNKAVAQAAVENLVEEHKQVVAIAKPDQSIIFKPVYFMGGPVVQEAQFKQVLARSITFETIATGISVNGSIKCAVKDKATAEQVLADIKQTYQVDPQYTLSFEQDVDLVDLPVKADRVLSRDKAVKLLKGDSDKPRYYTVKSGDTLWDIAVACNLSPEELQAANPGLTPEKMQIGQQIKMVGALEPIINVIATAEKTVREDIILAQEVRRNPNLPYGQSKVIQQGEKGLREVTYSIVAVNGLEKERKVLKETVLKEAKPQIVERSSQTMIASRGISKPAGAILSPFGMRGGRMHTGVDIAGPYGSPIRASQAGTVIRAGWYGGYGNCVDINHGGGAVTRYAHLSSISVRNGQTVEKGDIVGKLGSTGRSSGPHLHFEVIINGVPKNPVGYL